MSQFKFQNDMNNLLNLDGELKMNSKPRWQRKMENSMNASSMNGSKLSVSYNNSYVAGMGLNSTTTGSKTPNKSITEGASKKKTPSEKKSPGMNKRSRRSRAVLNSSSLLLGRNKTPTHGSKTPTSSGDRFIPNRGATNFELSHYLVSAWRSHPNTFT